MPPELRQTPGKTAVVAKGSIRALTLEDAKSATRGKVGRFVDAVTKNLL